MESLKPLYLVGGSEWEMMLNLFHVILAHKFEETYFYSRLIYMKHSFEFHCTLMSIYSGFR